MDKPEAGVPIAVQRTSSVRWFIASMAGAFAFVSYVQRMNISVAAELMMPDLGISKNEMGQVFSSFLWGYAIFQLPVGRLGDAIGPRITLALAALFWGLTTVLTGLLPRMFAAGSAALLIGLMAVRFVLGATEAATFPVGSRAIRNWTPPGERAFANSFMMAGSASAAAASAPLVSWLMVRFGWRPAFYITSLFAFAIAAVWYIAVRDDPRQHKWVSQQELRRIHPGQAERHTHPASLSQILGNRDILFLSLSYTCEGYVLFIFVFWLYIYLVEVRGFSLLHGGLAASLPWLAALASAPIGGFVCDRLSESRGRFAGARMVIILGYGLSGCLLFAAAKFHGRFAVIAALCVSVAALYFAEPAFWATAVHLSKENAGAVSGIMNTAGILGGIVSTSVTPVIVKYFGWLPALGSGAAVAVACAGLWLVIGRRPPRTAPDQG
ncbi:MAG TPA: MFS transporter [Candidatus Sulfotelmatobacter sp.]|nr:MFS transporter [Candidatus Sulfotelmatobacter sp.]